MGYRNEKKKHITKLAVSLCSIFLQNIEFTPKKVKTNQNKLSPTIFI